MMPASVAGAVLRVEGVTKTFEHDGRETRALDDVSLTVPRGIVQGVIGFSGSGKTTLLRCLCGLERPGAGRVVVAGVDLEPIDGAALRAARRRLGVVFQQLHLLHSATVASNVALPLELAGWRLPEIDQRVTELLHWFGLSDKATQYPARLSGGQRQRVAIARALAMRPDILLTDEPTSALDPETTGSVLGFLRRVRDELGVSIVLVTHELDAVRAIGDRVAVLDAGRIVEQGDVDEVLVRPASAAARRLTTPSIELLRSRMGDGQRAPA